MVEPGSCFAVTCSNFCSLPIRSTCSTIRRSEASIQVSTLNRGCLPMSNGLSRLQSRFLADPEKVDQILAQAGPLDAEAADELG